MRTNFSARPLSSTLAMGVVLVSTVWFNCTSAAAQSAQGDDNGCDTEVVNTFMFACGPGSTATAGPGVISQFPEAAVAIGPHTEARGGTTVGYQSVASTNAISIGNAAHANGDNSVALGTNSVAQSGNSIAVGAGANAALDGIAIGAGVQAGTRQIAVGTSSHTYTFAGIHSDASKEAQTGTAYMLTSDANGNLATSTFDLATLEGLPARMTAVESDVNGLQFITEIHDLRITNVETKNEQQDIIINEHTQQIATLDNRVTTNTQNINLLDNRVTNLESGFTRLEGRIDKAFEGAAMAMAMAAPAMPYDKNYAVSINWGNFEGANAFAGTAQARVSDNFILHGGIGYGSETQSVGGRAGVTFAW